MTAPGIRSIVGLLVAGATTMATAAAQASSPVVAQGLESASKVSAYSDVVAWTDYAQDRKGHVLTVRRAGRTTRLDVPPNSRPFDVDLGPGRGGAIVAVYSRCARPEPRIDSRFRSANWTSSRGCRIYRARIDGVGGEHAVRRTDVPNASEYLPSIWRGRIAFARLPAGARRPHLVVQRLDGGSERRYRGGPVGEYPAAARHPDLTPGPLSLDLRDERVAYVWTYGADGCPDSIPGRVEDSAGWSEIRVAGDGGRARVDRACNFAYVPSTVVGATWSDDRLLYVANDKQQRQASVRSSIAPFATTTLAPYEPVDSLVVSFTVGSDGIAFARGFGTSEQIVELLSRPAG